MKGDDDRNQQLLERLNQSGSLYLSHTVLNGRYTLRFCVGQTYTEERHVVQAWKKIQDTAAELERQ
jgi:aromatic-L-amino-acid decarboxylase